MSKSVLKSSEVDSTGLRKLLNEISAQITIPYLQKRASSNLHKQTPLDELKDAISYISDKERELQIALDISKHLLDTNEDLQRKIVRLESNEITLISEYKALSSELKTYQALLEQKEIKYEYAKSTLAETESELMKLTVDFQRGHNKNCSGDSLLNSDSFEKEIYEMQNNYQQEIEKYVRNYEDLDKKFKKLVNEKEKLENNLNKNKEQYENVSSKHRKAVEKLKESERVQKIVLDNNEKLEKKWKQAKENNEKLVDKVEKLMARIEKLEEEAKVLEGSSKTKASDSNQESLSLLYELKCLEENESSKSYEFDEEFFSPQSCFKNSRCSNTFTPNSKGNYASEFFEVFSCTSIEIPSKPKEIQKDPTEQYFILTTQAVKLNSPHMDTICMIPNSVLYEKAVAENIPFHKWHSWIETQLNFEYIQTLFKQKCEYRSSKKLFKRS